MSLALAKLSDLKAYFEAIAIGAHHHVDIDGYKFGNKNVVLSANKSDLEASFLWVEWYNPDQPFTVTDNFSDNVQKIKSVRIAMMVPTSRTTFAEHENAYEFCEGVIDQIYAKMYLDKRDLTIVVNAQSFKYGPTEITLGSTEYTGCAMSFDFIDNQGLIYNTAKWTP